MMNVVKATRVMRLRRIEVASALFLDGGVGLGEGTEARVESGVTYLR